MSNTLKIITSRLFKALMRCNRCISSCTSQILAILKWNVFSLAIAVTLCESKVNDVDAIAIDISSTNKEVVRLNISMQDSLLVDLLHMSNQLKCNQQNSLDIELLPTLLK